MTYAGKRMEYQDLLACCGRGIPMSSPLRSIGDSATCAVHGEQLVVATGCRTHIFERDEGEEPK